MFYYFYGILEKRATYQSLFLMVQQVHCMAEEENDSIILDSIIFFFEFALTHFEILQIFSNSWLFLCCNERKLWEFNPTGYKKVNEEGKIVMISTGKQWRRNMLQRVITFCDVQALCVELEAVLKNVTWGTPGNRRVIEPWHLGRW